MARITLSEACTAATYDLLAVSDEEFRNLLNAHRNGDVASLLSEIGFPAPILPFLDFTSIGNVPVKETPEV
jgi:hypothetical protein